MNEDTIPPTGSIAPVSICGTTKAIETLQKLSTLKRHDIVEGPRLGPNREEADAIDLLIDDHAFQGRRVRELTENVTRLERCCAMKEKERQYHMNHINRLEAALKISGEVTESIVDIAIERLKGITTKQAVDHLCKALQDDPGFAWVWHCNIAVPIMDVSRHTIGHMEANDIAAHLMAHLFGVKNSKDLMPKVREENDTASEADVKR